MIATTTSEPDLQMKSGTRLFRATAFTFMLLCCLLFVARGYHDERLADHQRDFKQPFSSARCLLTGCNPYSETDTRIAYLRAGGINDDPIVFAPYSALYPPFSLALLAPLAAIPYPVAQALWLWGCAGLFSVACLLTADLCGRFHSGSTVLCLGFFVVTSTILLMEGQVSTVAISLLVIGLWCFLRGRQPWLTTLCFTVALALKPHDALLLVLYFGFAGPRARVILRRTLVLTGLVVVAGCTWCSVHASSRFWMHDLLRNLYGNSGPGGVNEPVQANPQAGYLVSAQAIFGTFSSHPLVYHTGAYLLTAGLLALWLQPVLALRGSLHKHLLAIAGLACITLLPVYHRQYDTRLLLLIFPAVAMLVGTRHRFATMAVTLAAAAGVLTAYPLLRRVLDHPARVEAAGRLQTLLLYRPLPLVTLALALFFVFTLRAFWHAEQAQQG
ncbi:glycosyltransferase family 87 protein [Acidipila sp. EB88]|uniref:glycosyltransferase family 87 protein n=1 Tax=Acidipila sp. EB88 TaxID=2305226 RepID=UPI00131557D4|nr:glycosyltransferase family 87 protein [Acidipila sp. EB88]